MNRIVLDASAVLAMILNEPGGERVDALLDALELGSDAEVFISSVNWCEILTRMQREKLDMSGERLSAVLAGVELVPFGRAESEAAAAYGYVSRSLSLGDRACLALAKSQQASAWTTERLWSQCQLDVPVELIRG
ncbi:MAG: PIN domain-containing protein [Terracidiphilus sp.]